MKQLGSVSIVVLLMVTIAGCDTGSRHDDSFGETGLGTGVTGTGNPGGTNPGGNGSVTLTSVTPNAGSVFGGTAVALDGTGFAAGARAFFGQVEATNVAVNGAGTQITLTTPAHPAGVVDVQVLLSDGSTAQLNNAFTFDPTIGPSGPLARVADYGNPTAEEQEMLELANRARRNPTAEGQRVGVDLSGYQARPPLTHNGFLGAAAKGHTNDEQARNFYGHTNPDGIGPNRRVLAANYDLRVNGNQQDPGYNDGSVTPTINQTESIGIGQGNQFNTPQAVHDAFIIDQGQVPPKHRDSILGYGGQLNFAREVGYGVEFNQPRPSTTPAGASFAPDHWVTSEFARTQRDRAFITGVVYNDNGDGIARSGEGRAGVTVTLTHVSGFTLQTTTAAAGGYAFETFVDTDFTITIDGQSTTVSVAQDNVKVDHNGSNIVTY